MDEFWESRADLDAIRQMAHARRVSPWSTLGGVLARVVASAEPRVQLPPLVGGFGSLNLFIAIVGRSGQGKGASQSAAAATIDPLGGALFDTISIGSGEGIAAAYVQRAKDDDGNWIVHQHSESALLDVAEVDTVAALAGRQGSTLLAELRKVWSGERLGFQNRDMTRTLPVEAHTYRAALIAGVQPTRAGALLDDADGGTPQRFIWLPATDPDAPEHAPAPPPPIRWRMPGEDVLPTDGPRRVIAVCNEATSTIDRAQLARLRGNGHALDGHALFSRLKVAAALALLDHRGDVSPEDWALAGTVMVVSDRTRQHCRDAIADAARAISTARAEARGEASLIAGDAADAAALARAKERIVARLGRDWTAAAPIRSDMSARLREHFDSAVDALVGAGKVEVARDQYQGRERVRLRLSSPVLAESPALPASTENSRNSAAVSTGSPVLAESPALTTSPALTYSEAVQ